MAAFAALLVGVVIGGIVMFVALKKLTALPVSIDFVNTKDAVPVRRSVDALPRDRSQDALLAAFRPEDVPEPADALREDQRMLADALRDLAKRRGASAAVLWVLDETLGGVPSPVASSADEERSSLTPAYVPVVNERDRQKVEFSARERQISIDGDEAVRLVVAPIEAVDLPGALSLHFEPESSVTREQVREWLPDAAQMMQSWYTLVRTRADTARQNFRLRALIRSAGTLQASRDPLELERLLVADALTVAGAQWAVLVRWDGQQDIGEVRAATANAVTAGVNHDGHRIGADTLVGDVCVGGKAAVHPDVRAFGRGQDVVFGGDVPLVGVGTLLIVPLHRSHEEKAIGALVCGHQERAAMSGPELRNARNLGVIAAGALETAWTIEDARRNARTDPLTGLANRRGFSERFAQVITETDRYGGSAALVLMDVDFFKKVNDTYGHEAGDAVLVALGEVVAEGRRTVDLAARLGGEELALILPQTDMSSARELAERLRKRIESLSVRTNSGEVRVTTSFGVAEYSARSGEGDKVFERADQALYAAKRNGRNRVETA
jgi:diguanylate cyclase (GGDEF)-like protein